MLVVIVLMLLFGLYNEFVFEVGWFVIFFEIILLMVLVIVFVVIVLMLCFRFLL